MKKEPKPIEKRIDKMVQEIHKKYINDPTIPTYITESDFLPTIRQFLNQIVKETKRETLEEIKKALPEEDNYDICKQCGGKGESMNCQRTPRLHYKNGWNAYRSKILQKLNSEVS